MSRRKPIKVIDERGEIVRRIDTAEAETLVKDGAGELITAADGSQEFIVRPSARWQFIRSSLSGL